MNNNILDIFITFQTDNMLLDWFLVFNIEGPIFDEKVKSLLIKPFINEHFDKKYLTKDGLKMLSILNNKVVLQHDENTYLFSLKNEKDSDRFLLSLENYFLSINRNDVLIVRNVSSPNKKYLYKILEEKGFDKRFLYRKTTTHPS